MKTLKSKITLKDVILNVLGLALPALFVWWGMHFPGPIPPAARADTFPITCAATPTPPSPIVDGTPLPNPTCSPSATPYITGHPGFENLPNNPNGADLAWVQLGGVDAQHKKPGVIVNHGTNWNAGSPGQVQGETQDLADAGFFAAAVWYELAPNRMPADGYIPGQPCHDTYDVNQAGWRMGQQTDDIKDYVNAMRADPRCNGWVAVLGGSAGASHAITVALDTNPSGHNGNDWPKWMGVNGDTRPNCAVMLSAIYDFADWTPPTGDTATDPDFVHFGLHNYVQSLILSTLAGLQLNPVNLVDGAKTKGFKPIYMINSYGDHPTAYHQLVTMVCLLQSKGLNLGTDYQYLTIPGSMHSFHYWGSWDGQPCIGSCNTVAHDVIAFLKAQAGLP